MKRTRALVTPPFNRTSTTRNFHEEQYHSIEEDKGKEEGKDAEWSEASKIRQSCPTNIFGGDHVAQIGAERLIAAEHDVFLNAHNDPNTSIGLKGRVHGECHMQTVSTDKMM